MKLLVLCCFSTLILASEQSKAPLSLLEWPGGHIDISETAAWLGQSGNETRLDVTTFQQANQSDREFPFSSGTYWEGVVAIMDYHQLEMAYGDKSITFHRTQTQDSGIQHPILGIGPTKLVSPEKTESPSPQKHYIPCGPVLLEVRDARINHYQAQQTTSIELGYYAHLEPRFGFNDIGYVAITWKPMGTASTRIPWPNILTAQQTQRSFAQVGSYQGRLGPNVIRSKSTNILQLSQLDLEATCDVVYTELRSSKHTLDVDESTTFQMDESTADWTMTLLGPTEGQPRYHKIALEVPSSERYQGAINIEVTDQDGTRIHQSGRTTNWASQQNTISSLTYLQTPKSMPVTITLEVRAVVARTSHRIAQHMDFPR